MLADPIFRCLNAAKLDGWRVTSGRSFTDEEPASGAAAGKTSQSKKSAAAPAA